MRAYLVEVTWGKMSCSKAGKTEIKSVHVLKEIINDVPPKDWLMLVPDRQEFSNQLAWEMLAISVNWLLEVRQGCQLICRLQRCQEVHLEFQI